MNFTAASSLHAIVMVSAAYLIMFAIVFDYSRWISNWAVCMFLILHAVKTLPGSKQVPLISANDPKDHTSRLDRYPDSARRDRKAVLVVNEASHNLLHSGLVDTAQARLAHPTL